MSSASRLISRGAGGISRRLGRPELLAAVDPVARRVQREDIGICAVLAATLRASGVFVDVGTNRGQVLAEAVRIAPTVRHLAFEPIPALAAEVSSRFAGVECRNLALSDAPGTSEFCWFRHRDGWSGLRRSPEIADSEGEPEFIEVQVSTLDAELEGVAPAVVKIDVEGAEVAVLRGARGVLESSRPVLVFEHVYEAAALYGAERGEPWDILEAARYEVFSVTGRGPYDRAGFCSGGDVVNWLAVPRR